MEGKILTEVKKLIKYIKSKEGVTWNPAKILQSCTLNVIYSFLFSERLNYDDRENDHLSLYISSLFDAFHPILTVFPVFAHLPPLRNVLTHIRSEVKGQGEYLERKIQDCMNQNTPKDNFVQEYVKDLNPSECDIKELSFVIRDIVIGATETTSTQIEWALLLLSNRPKTLENFQKEIGAAVPKDRLPSFDDRTKLPFFEATILEIMRYSTIGPLIMRYTDRETEVGGYLIPSDSVVLVNLWAAHNDPQVWKGPESFRPERFLDAENRIINNDLVISFSIGKRACLGEILARQELFLLLAALLQQFNILPPEGETSIREEIKPGAVLHPAEYSIRLVQRE